MLRDYPKLRIQLEDPTPPPLTSDDRLVVEAVQKAVQRTEQSPNGAGKLKLIRYMYWSATPVPGKTAALRLGISEITAKRWHGSFIRETARCYGFAVPEPTVRPVRLPLPPENQIF